MRLSADAHEVVLYDDHDEVVGRVGPEEFVTRLVGDHQTRRIPTGLLAPRVLWLRDDHRAVVFERPPSLVHLAYHSGNASHHGTDLDVTIPLPWTVYGLVFHRLHNALESLYVFARNEPITSLEDPLGVLALPNQSTASAACLGAGFYKHYQRAFAKHPAPVALAERVNVALNTYWTGVFNNDIPQWSEPWRFATEVPPGIAQSEEVARSYNYLQYLGTQTKVDVAAWHYPQANVFTEADTVATLVAALEDHGRPQLRSTHEAFARLARAVIGFG